MSSEYGKNIRISIFGQSHSPAIGMTLEGIQRSQVLDNAGHWADLYFYGLLREEWSAGAALKNTEGSARSGQSGGLPDPLL